MVIKENFKHIAQEMEVDGGYKRIHHVEGIGFI